MPFIPWRHLPCGVLLETEKDAREHLQLMLLGPNKCRKLYGKVSQRPKGQVGQRRSKKKGTGYRFRRAANLPRVDRAGWRKERAFLVYEVGQETRRVPLWTVERRP